MAEVKKLVAIAIDVKAAEAPLLLPIKELCSVELTAQLNSLSQTLCNQSSVNLDPSPPTLIGAWLVVSLICRKSVMILHCIVTFHCNLSKNISAKTPLCSFSPGGFGTRNRLIICRIYRKLVSVDKLEDSTLDY